MKTLQKFKIYPESGKKYFEVLIFETHSIMLQVLRKDGITTSNDTEAYCSCVNRLNRLGRIYFYISGIGNGTIAHEVIHATSGYLAVKGEKFLEYSFEEATKSEERFCEVVDGLVDQIYKKLKL
jgi:hypothetical protein